MLPAVSLSDAAARRWDVVIAGSSFAGMFFLRALPPGLSVLVVEKGAVQDHAALIANRALRPAEAFSQDNRSGEAKEWIAHTLFGGNSNCWWGCTPRFHPADFAMASRYGVGEDWPLTYDDLAPYYDEVEAVMEISGGGSDHILPRRAPFPYPPHAPTRSDLAFRKGNSNWFAQPTARSNGGSRGQCCANGVCDLCPVDAKFTILNGIDAFAHDGAALLPETDLRAVQIEAGMARGALLRGSDGREAKIGADLVALAANAVFNAAILMRSGAGGPAVGQGLTEQASRYLKIEAPGLGYFGGTSITGHGYDLYDGPWRADHSGVLVEVYNTPRYVRTEPGRWTDVARLKLIVEDMPDARNRVELKDDEPHLVWHGYSDYAYRAFDWAADRLAALLPLDIERVSLGDVAPTEAHILCTHPMGPDPARHVTDADLKVHGVPNLLALGGGAFPTPGLANPTLTLAALSTRAGRRLA